MKQRVLTIILAMIILTGLAGCQTKNSQADKEASFKYLFRECLKASKIDEAQKPSTQKLIKEPCDEILGYYYQWQKIDGQNISAKDRNRIRLLDQHIKKYGLIKEDLRFIAFFPWIDANHLTAKDKLFLLRIGDEMAAEATKR